MNPVTEVLTGIYKGVPVAHFTFEGVTLALVFAVSMSALIWWMLSVPPHITAAAAKARRGVGAIKKILVPTIGLPYSERGVELACRLGDEQKAEIILSYVIEVPRTLPLDHPLPQAEAKANDALERAISIVTLRGLKPVSKIDRARIAGEEIIRTAREDDVDLIVLGIKPKPYKNVLGTTTEILLRRAPCEVIVDKVQEE
ncbi:MAG: universal stress protein [Elusimicrobiota bacterium]